MNQFKAKGKLNVRPLSYDYIIANSQKKLKKELLFIECMETLKYRMKITK